MTTSVHGSGQRRYAISSTDPAPFLTAVDYPKATGFR